MRIIGGQAKRRALKSPSAAQGVRPILARIKKSLFDILRLRVPNSRFLDLYAGSGAVGIEALSRGATHATFVEQNPHCMAVIRQNIHALDFKDKSTLITGSVSKVLFSLNDTFDL